MSIKTKKTLNSLLDSPIAPGEEKMIKVIERRNKFQIPLEQRSEEARGARLVEQKIRVEFMRPPHNKVFLCRAEILWALEYMFDNANEKYLDKMTSLLYISRYFKQILTKKKK